MAETDVIVYDEEYEYAARVIREYCNTLVNIIDAYKNCINTVLNSAIKDEKITNALKNVVFQVDSVKEEIISIGSEAATSCKGFVSAIDLADDFLY